MAKPKKTGTKAKGKKGLKTTKKTKAAREKELSAKGGWGG